jgi:adenylylsulfate kinase
VSGVVMWFTGLPSSGKSTLAREVAKALKKKGTPHLLLDGDAVRAALVPKPGYDEASRDDFYATLANLAALCARSGLVVLVPATAHLASYRRHAREVAPAFIEVFVDVPREVAVGRDAKGLYRAVEAGELGNVPGADVAYERPLAPEAVVGEAMDDDDVDSLVGMIQEKA